jgi:hypothetical protein
LRGTNPDFNIEVQKLVHRFNDRFPDANLEGSAYENKRLDDNGLIVMVGEKGLDDSDAALSLFQTGPVKETKRVSSTTYCGMTEIEKKPESGRVGGHVMCLTETTPSVVTAYFPFEADKHAFTVKQLGDLASSLQGDL